MTRHCLALPLFLLFFWQPAISASLPVYYIEYPPYYYSENGTHKGFLLDQAEKIFRQAGLTPVFESGPAKRILNNIQLNKGPLASIGWYKTYERTRYAKFTRPIYVNKPVVLVCLKKNDSSIGRHETLTEVLSDDTLVFGRIQGYSDGDFIDKMVDESSAKIWQIVGTQKILMRMLLAERVSYVLLAPEEVAALAKAAAVELNLLSQLSMKDIPFGSKRYIMCSQSVSDKIIDKLNYEIIKNLGEIPD